MLGQVRAVMRYIIIGAWVLFVGMLLSLFTLFHMIQSDFQSLFGKLPDLERLENPRVDESSILYAADGVALGKYYRENRVPCLYEELSKPLIETVLVAEDIRFFSHSGIDLRSLLRAILGKLTFRYLGGGSTLTMQLAENLYRTSTKNHGSLYERKKIAKFVTKFKEWIIAIQLERIFTKEEILTMYLNTVPFGSNAFGIHTAARVFFNTHPQWLDYSQSALLVGIINAPTRYSPIINPENALKKRNKILQRMHRFKKVSTRELYTLQKLPLQLSYRVESHNTGTATYFRKMVRNFMVEWCEKNHYDLFGDGLKIYTTLDSRMQAHAEEAISNHMRGLQASFDEHWTGRNPWIDEEGKEIKNFLEDVIKTTSLHKDLEKEHAGDVQKITARLHEKKKMRVFSWAGEIDTIMSSMDSLAYYKRFLHAGFLTMSPTTGEIKTWVGGINHKYFKFDHIKQGKRQPGSTIKPFVYTAVIDNGYSPCHEVIDKPVTFHLPGQDPNTWTPENADGPPSGTTMTIREALARSVNSISAYWVQKIGIKGILKYVRKMGIKSPIAPVPALCLGGGGDVSLYEMLGAYATFANKGIWTEPTFISRIEDKDGNILYEAAPERVEALSEETAYIMLHMLKGSVEERGGTAVGLPYTLKKDNEIGAKTGTTQNASDGWFFGLTQDLIGGAWVGGDNRSVRFRNWTMGQGARTALPIWRDFMLKVYEDSLPSVRKRPFEQPGSPLRMPLLCTDDPRMEKQSFPIEPARDIEDIF